MAVSPVPRQVRQIRFRLNRERMLTPASMVIVQREFAHDVAVAVLDNSFDTSSVYQTEVPIEIDFGQERSTVKTMLGYVHHTEPIGVMGTSQTADVKVVCVGASYVLDAPQRKNWPDYSPSLIAKEIADAVKFSGRIQVVPETVSMMQDKSNWAFLADLAIKVGWTFNAENTDISFQDPFDDLFAKMAAASFFAPRIPGRQGPPNEIHTFHAVAGETTPDGGQKAARRLSGVDAWSGATFMAVGESAYALGTITRNPVFNYYERDQVYSYAEASSTLEGKTKANRFHIQANAEVRGDARVRPGQLVFFDGLGPRHSGYWYVHSAEHEFTSDDYVLHLSLGRDSEWERSIRPDRRPRVPVRFRQNPYGTLVAETPPSVLVNGRWRAAYGPRLG